MIKIDIKVGDTILTGKWKNKKVVVKSIGEDEFKNPTVNGKSILKIRIPKLYQKESTMNEAKKFTQGDISPADLPAFFNLSDEKRKKYLELRNIYPHKDALKKAKLKESKLLMKNLLNEDVFEAYFKMDKWMPEDAETQMDWLKILKKKNVKEVERFIDENANYEVLKRYLGNKSVADLAKYILKAHSHLDSKELEYWR